MGTWLIFASVALLYLMAPDEGSAVVDSPDSSDVVGAVLGTVGGFVSLGANTYSEVCTQLTKSEEGCSLMAYPDANGHSIGWGHFGATAGETISQAQADDYLASDLTTAANLVNNLVTVDITQPMFDALTDFAYNIGGSKFASSTLLLMVNAGDFTTASAQFARWTYSQGKVVPALQSRRSRESALFASGVTA